jgi:antitoxin HigA-1
MTRHDDRKRLCMTDTDRLPNVHPGEVLREDFLEPLGKTVYWLSKGIGMSQTAVKEILDGKRGVTPNTALRLSRFFGTSPEVWLNLQAMYDLEEERRKRGPDLEKIRHYEAAA